MQSYKLWNTTPFYMEGEEDPQIHYYPAENKTHDGTVVIFPGGGYVHRAEHEGRGYAEFLNANGMDAFVVDYRVAPYTHPTQLLDARRAVRFVRVHAEKFGIAPDKIGVMGSSAGGNLTALLCTYTSALDGEEMDELAHIDCMPNAQIHCYSYISFAEDGIRIDWCTEKLFPGKVGEMQRRFLPSCTFLTMRRRHFCSTRWRTAPSMSYIRSDTQKTSGKKAFSMRCTFSRRAHTVWDLVSVPTAAILMRHSGRPFYGTGSVISDSDDSFYSEAASFEAASFFAVLRSLMS